MIHHGNADATAFAQFVRDKIATPFFIPEEAVDYTKTTGKMRVLGAGTDASAASIRNQITKAFALAADAAMVDNPAAVAETLAKLGVTNLDEEGNLLVKELGKRIALMQTGIEALDMTGIDPNDALAKFGIDPRLFNLKLSGKSHLTNLAEGIQEGLALAEEFVTSQGLDDDAKARFNEIRNRFDTALGSDVKTVGELIAISSESKYATAAIHLGAADNFATMLGNANRRAFQARSAAEIDIFYMKRQGAPIASDVQSEAGRIVKSVQQQMIAFDEFSKEINRAEAAEGFEKAQLERARANLGEEVRQDIVQSVERLRAAGYDNLTELDFYDAIQLEERTQKVAHRELATLGEIDPAIPNRLSELKRLSELRRNYFGLVSETSFVGSDTQKVQQILDRHLSYLTDPARAKAEKELAENPEAVQKMLNKISGIDSLTPTSSGAARAYKRGPGGAPRVPTFSELISGIMTEDEFSSIRRFGNLNLDDEALKAAKEAAAAAGESEDLLIRNVGGVRRSIAEVGTLYQARAAGFESMYMDPATGRVTIPAITDAAGSTAGGAARTLAGQRYKRIGQAIRDGDLKRLIEKPYVKGTIAGILALGAFGFIHSARKDHTPEDLAGPPLLPGGSAYESGYPGNNLNLTPQNYPMISGQNGVTYRINASGSNTNARRFGDSLGALMPGASSATYYNSIKDLNVDPYKEMGNSF